MKVELVPSIEYVDNYDLENKTVIVIDVLRATSVITTAMASGAELIMPVLEVEEAFSMKEKGYLAGGERKGLKIEGFDFSNSPCEYTEEAVNGRKIALSTTNGTKTILKCRAGKNLYLASMLNGSAVAEKASASNLDTVVVCSGTNGKFSIDDYICAGKIIAALSRLCKIDTDDFAAASMLAYEDRKMDVTGYVSHAFHYNYLISINLQEDIAFCFREDTTKVVPYVEKSDDGKAIVIKA